VKNKNFNKDKQKEQIPSSDHRTLGQQLELYSINDQIGVGLVLWHPKGMTIRRLLRDLWEDEHLKHGYKLVNTPHIARGELWKTSGHLEYFTENMYLFEKENESYVVKPMNCPFHIQIYNSQPRSYRELPIRYAEWGTVYRYERSGTLHGLMRVRGYTCDDAHIFCRSNQLEEEVMKVIDLNSLILERLGFSDYRIDLSTRDPDTPEKYLGSEEEWHSAQRALANTLDKKKISYNEMPGEAAFYGPKIDIQIVDSYNREWQCSTIQFDFNLPRRFNLSYVGADGEMHRPIMIHRALLGSVERFFGILIEHYKGNFPAWLAPVQVIVLPLSDNYNRYAREVQGKFSKEGVRTELDDSSSTINYKIRKAETQKIPYLVICGKREAESETISVRKHGRQHLGTLNIQELVNRLKNN
jgi:threonyl-tRNA synthetase